MYNLFILLPRSSLSVLPLPHTSFPYLLFSYNFPVREIVVAHSSSMIRMEDLYWLESFHSAWNVPTLSSLEFMFGHRYMMNFYQVLV